MKSRVFLLIGEPFSVQEKIRAILARIGEHVSERVSPQKFRLNETPLGEILTQARTLPFLTSAQVFWVRDAEVLTKDDLALLRNYFRNPPGGTFLIFESKSLGKNKQVGQLLAQFGEVKICEDRDKRSAVSQFIFEKLQSASKTMTPQAMRRLEEGVGAVPEFLDSILEQLILYSDRCQEITEGMVELFEEKLGEADAFKLVNLIGSRKTAEALAVLSDLTGGNEREVIPLVGLLHWQLRRLWLARISLDQGMAEPAALKKCRVYPKQAPYFLRHLRAFSRAQLERALEGLFDLDWKLKTGRLQGAFGLEAWLVRTMS